MQRAFAQQSDVSAALRRLARGRARGRAERVRRQLSWRCLVLGIAHAEIGLRDSATASAGSSTLLQTRQVLEGRGGDRSPRADRLAEPQQLAVQLAHGRDLPLAVCLERRASGREAGSAGQRRGAATARATPAAARRRLPAFHNESRSSCGRVGVGAGRPPARRRCARRATAPRRAARPLRPP